jgi:hypothetical protein
MDQGLAACVDSKVCELLATERQRSAASNTEEISALWFLYGHCDRHRREEIEKGEKVVAEMWRTQRDIIEGLLRRLV